MTDRLNVIATAPYVWTGASQGVLSSMQGFQDITEAQKEEASISRLYGGIHYRSDIAMGKEHRKRIGGCSVRFAQLDGADVRQ